jgi:hypothetical protein
MRGHLHPYEYYDDTKKRCILFIGLSKISSTKVLTVGITTPLPVPVEVQRRFLDEANKLKGPGMEVELTHQIQERMAPLLAKLFSDCASERS